MPAYSWTLMCSSYHGPSRSPAGRPAAASVAATNDPYIVSLSSSAGGGTSEPSRMPATVLLPAPGGPATTQAGAWTLMLSEDMAPRWPGPELHGGPDRPSHRGRGSVAEVGIHQAGQLLPGGQPP